MKVQLYDGSLNLVKKSGVGQALLHQEAMLKEVGIETTRKNEKDADIIHINTVFPDSVIAAIIAKIRGKNVIYYGHSTMEDFRNSFCGSDFAAPIFKHWIKLCYSLGDVIITPTEYSKRLLTEYGIKKPIYALSNGIDTNFFDKSKGNGKKFRKKYKIGSNEKIVLSVGHYIERKGILEFINMAKEMPNVHFFWFGYTDLNIVPKNIRVAVRCAPKNLIFPGYVDRNELRDAYCGSDIFCFMSHEETEGIVVLEALSCGIPVIVRDIPVYRDWLTDGQNVYKCGNKKEFKDTVLGILSQSLPKLTDAGRCVALGLDIYKTGKKLTKIYENTFYKNQITRDINNRVEYAKIN